MLRYEAAHQQRPFGRVCRFLLTAPSHTLTVTFYTTDHLGVFFKAPKVCFSLPSGQATSLLILKRKT